MDRLPPNEHKSLKLLIDGMKIIQPILAAKPVSTVPYSCKLVFHRQNILDST